MRKLPLILIPLLLGAANDAGFDQRVGSILPLPASFIDDQGKPSTLGEAIGGRPAVLALVYYRCPNLCGFLLRDLTRALVPITEDYSLIVASIDPAEAPAEAAESRARFDSGGRRNWHFLTGDAVSLERAVGFKARRDPRNNQFIHPAGLIVLSPEGRINSYVLGLGYSTEVLRESLQSARSGIERAKPSPIRLICFTYDAATGQYSLAVSRILGVMAALTAAALGFFIIRGRR